MSTGKIKQAPIISIAFISAAALSYEILLMRLFSIIQWHHFAYMIISLSLLGYGASGTFVALFQDRLNRHYSRSYIVLLGLFGISAYVCFLLAQSLPFNPEEVLWDDTQPLILLALYLLLAIPFFFAASAIALTFSHFSHSIGKIYAFDLFGAGAGSLAVVGFLFLLLPYDILAGVSLFAFLATFIATIELKSNFKLVAFVITIISMLMLSIAFKTELKLSPYKELPQTLRIAGMQTVAQHSSPLGLLDVVESTSIPLRHAPGLSFMASTEPPPQVGIFTDGGNMSVINKDTGDLSTFSYLDQMTTALPYHLKKPEDVLILGAGGGTGIQQARYQQVSRIIAVELNPQLADLVKKDYGDFSGHLFEQDNVDLHIGEGRGFVTESEKQYDLIQVSLLDAFAASSAGLYALNESYIYTVEALQTYLQHIKPGGYLTISRWIKLPPRDSLKLFATAIEALKASGSSSPEKQLMLIRSWQTSTLVIKNSPFNTQEIGQLQAFCKERAFDLAWYPGMQANEANLYNHLREPYFYQAAVAILGHERDSFMGRYKFNLYPSTDDRPYFFHFFKWSVLPEILELRGQGGMPLLEWGYLVSITTFIQAIFVSIVLILLPLWALKGKNDKTKSSISRMKVFTYFFAIGLAFLFIEIAFIQKFILFLHHPLYATATVITGFLVFAGLGSLWSQKVTTIKQYRKNMKMAVAGIAILSVSYLVFFSTLPVVLLSLPLLAKIMLSLVLIAPLAFLMGLPFPLALTSLGKNNNRLIPWAWGINGCASVISAILATLLAIHAGFSIVIILAVLLYGLALLSFPAEYRS
jgi:MFS family permease